MRGLMTRYGTLRLLTAIAVVCLCWPTAAAGTDAAVVEAGSDVVEMDNDVVEMDNDVVGAGNEDLEQETGLPAIDRTASSDSTRLPRRSSSFRTGPMSTSSRTPSLEGSSALSTTCMEPSFASLSR